MPKKPNPLRRFRVYPDRYINEFVSVSIYRTSRSMMTAHRHARKKGERLAGFWQQSGDGKYALKGTVFLNLEDCDDLTPVHEFFHAAMTMAEWKKMDPVKNGKHQEVVAEWMSQMCGQFWDKFSDTEIRERCWGFW